MKPSYDAVVIGSGFGGAVLACRLAQSRRSVCVLERGNHHPFSSFPQSLVEAKDAIWDKKKKRFGYLEYRAFPHVDVIQGSGVGGGSLHYFGVSLRAPADIFSRPSGGEQRWPYHITRRELDPYYDLAEAMLGVQIIRTTPELPRLPRKTVAFKQAVHATGRQAECVPLAVNFETSISQDRSCDYRGHCLLGCGSGAKKSLDHNYLRVAMDHGAKIFPLCEADYIEAIPGDRYRICIRRLDKDTSETVEASTVIIAAGTLRTTELLLRSKELGKMSKLSASLGCRFSANGDYLYAGTIMPRGVLVEPTRGPSITAAADFSTQTNRIYIEDLGISDAFTLFLCATILKRKHFLRRLRRLLSNLEDRAINIACRLFSCATTVM